MGKKCVFFFHNPLQPIPRLHIAARDPQRFQRNASVKSLLTPIGWSILPISVQPIAVQGLRGKGGKIMKNLWKKTFLPDHPVGDICLCNVLN